MLGQRWLTAVIAGVSAVMLAGCGGAGHSSAPPSSTPAAVDVSTLDTGNYSTSPRKLGRVGSDQEGRVAESTRMAEAVVLPTAVDPSLVLNYGGVSAGSTTSPKELAKSLSFTGEGVAEPVLTKYGMVSAFSIAKTSEAVATESERTSLSIWLARFPDQAAAENAAVEIDATDFAVNRDNVAVPITKYPMAHGHWRPTVPHMVSTLAHGDLVIHVAVVNPTPNLNTLTGKIEKTFDEEISLLDRFQPTPMNEMSRLPKDPDGLFGRLIDITPGTEPILTPNIGTYGPNGANVFQNDRQFKDKVFQKAGVDRFAIWITPTQLQEWITRARDRDAATQLIDDMMSRDQDLDHPVDSPRNLPDAKCFEQKKSAYKDAPDLRFACYLSYDRYVAGVTSPNEADVRQRAAAQYALLVNPL